MNTLKRFCFPGCVNRYPSLVRSAKVEYISPAGANQPRSIANMGSGAMLDELGVPKPVFNMPSGCKIFSVVQASKVVLRSL